MYDKSYTIDGKTVTHTKLYYIWHKLTCVELRQLQYRDAPHNPNDCLAIADNSEELFARLPQLGIEKTSIDFHAGRVTFLCDKCNQVIDIENTSITTGYGRGANDEKICYACCAEGDKAYMREHGKITLYLKINRDERKRIKNGTLTNWPGSLTIPAGFIKKGRHNIAGLRYDTWFAFEGFIWHAVQYGEWTEIAHCKRTKEQVK